MVFLILKSFDNNLNKLIDYKNAICETLPSANQNCKCISSVDMTYINETYFNKRS